VWLAYRYVAQANVQRGYGPHDSRLSPAWRTRTAHPAQITTEEAEASRSAHRQKQSASCPGLVDTNAPDNQQFLIRQTSEERTKTKMNSCPKWWCGGRMFSRTIRLVPLRPNTLCEVVERYCAKCGFRHDDFRFYPDPLRVSAAPKNSAKAKRRQVKS
jgi:hypothetical protein